jgi:hypothetical protein
MPDSRSQSATFVTLAASLLSAFLLIGCASPAASAGPHSASPITSGGEFLAPATEEASASSEATVSVTGWAEPFYPPVAAKLKNAPPAMTAMPDRPPTWTALVRFVVVPSPTWQLRL